MSIDEDLLELEKAILDLRFQNSFLKGQVMNLQEQLAQVAMGVSLEIQEDQRIQAKISALKQRVMPAEVVREIPEEKIDDDAGQPAEAKAP